MLYADSFDFEMWFNIQVINFQSCRDGVCFKISNTSTNLLVQVSNKSAAKIYTRKMT